MPILIAMKGMCVKSFNDSVRLSNTSGSIILVDEAIPAYDAYVDSFSQVDIAVVDQRTTNVAPEVAEIPVRTIAQLLELDQFGDQYATYRCTVTINCIDEKKGWWYKGCTACKRLVVKDDHGYMCRRCGVKDSFIARFKTILNVSDSSGSAEFLLFDGPCAELFRVTAPVALKASPDGIACPKFMHKHVENTNMIFDVKVNSTDNPGDIRSYIVAKSHNAEGGSSSGTILIDTSVSMSPTPIKNIIDAGPKSSTPITPTELEILKKINVRTAVNVSSNIDQYSLGARNDPVEDDSIKSSTPSDEIIYKSIKSNVLDNILESAIGPVGADDSLSTEKTFRSTELDLPTKVIDKLDESVVSDNKPAKRHLDFSEKNNAGTPSPPTSKRSARAKTSKMSSIMASAEPSNI